MSFRDTASFGKRIEYSLIGEMLKEGLDVYTPMVDDMGIDAVIRRKDGTFIEVQIKARSDNTRFGDSGLFTVNKHENFRKNYFFVFYSTRLNTKWILNSDEFVKEFLLGALFKIQTESSIGTVLKIVKPELNSKTMKFDIYDD